MPGNRASASTVPRPMVSGSPIPSSRSAQAHIRSQIPQPDPGGVREEHQDQGDLRQRFDRLMGRLDSERRQQPVGQQHSGQDERDRRGHVESLQPGRQRPPREHQRRHDRQIRSAHRITGISCQPPLWQLVLVRRPCRYRRRETRRAVRRPVRRATLRAPNISDLQVLVLAKGHALLFAAASVSSSCNCCASSAEASPIPTRSSGLMKPSLMRKPPARRTASRSGTAQ